MTMKALRLAGITLSLAILMAGCPTDSGDGGDDGDGGDTGGVKALTGTWSGTLNCTETQSLGGAPFQPRESTQNLTIQFGDDGLPVSVTILSFTNEPNPVVSVKNVGDTATSTITNGGANSTYVITVRSATYSSTRARLTLDINYSSVNAAATSTGTGVQTIDALVNGSNLTYAANVNYSVELTNPNLDQPFQSGDEKDCTGTLTKQ